MTRDRGALRDAWALDPGVTYLNHGGFGACLREVLAIQSELRARLEAEPARFLTRELEPLLDDARGVLAGFVGARAGDLAFVPNATTGVNAVLRSLGFSAGDELLTTNHAYNASLNALRFVAERSGASVAVARLPFPPLREADLADAVLQAVTPRTRLVLLDQVTSPTALVLPVGRLVRAIEARGVMVLVDAAHGPGMVPLALDDVGASFTTGSLHKWVCAPKGAGFLHVRPDRQDLIRPTVISHGANSPRTGRSRFQLEFGWTGTADPTPYLCVPHALACMASLDPGGWPGIMQANCQAARAATRLLEAVVPQSAPPVVEGAMASLVLPGRAEQAGALQDRLLLEHRIEVPVIPFEGRRLLRVSMQRYNAPADVARLARVLPGLLLAA